LTTLHTNTALGAVARLIDMGLEPFLLASSLHGLLAQRLVRTLCNNCKRWEIATKNELELLDLTHKNVKICKAVGCVECHNTGYRGRTSIYEWISVTDELRSMIHKHESEQALEKYVRKYSKSIKEIGIEKVLNGITTVAEMLRVTI
jgi:general secretion pathway protein E